MRIPCFIVEFGVLKGLPKFFGCVRKFFVYPLKTVRRNAFLGHKFLNFIKLFLISSVTTWTAYTKGNGSNFLNE